MVSMFLGGCAADDAEIASPANNGGTTEAHAPATPDAKAKGEVALPGTYGEQAQFRITVAGGDDSSDVFSAPFSNDGKLGEWRREASLSAKGGVTLVHANEGYLAIGANGVVLRSIEDTAGIAHWREMGRLEAANGAGVASNGSSVLVLGGDSGKGPRTSTMTAVLDNGLPETFMETEALPTGVAFAGTTRLGAYTFVTGGTTANGATADVLVARAKETRGVETWKSSTALPKAISDHAVMTNLDSLYVLGGKSDVFEDAILGARMSDAGELGKWTEIGKLPSGRAGMCVATSGNRIVVIGGQAENGGIAEVLTTTIEADGSLAKWTMVGKLPNGIAHAGCGIR